MLHPDDFFAEMMDTIVEHDMMYFYLSGLFYDEYDEDQNIHKINQIKRLEKYFTRRHYAEYLDILGQIKKTYPNEKDLL